MSATACSGATQSENPLGDACVALSSEAALQARVAVTARMAEVPATKRTAVKEEEEATCLSALQPSGARR